MENIHPPIEASEGFIDNALRDAWKEASRIIENLKETKALAKYADDPVAFGNEVLGDTYTEEIEQVMISVRDNPVTIARSATGPGKSHAAARIGIWFYKVYENAKVYMTAAPPFDNLKRILWGEVMGVVRQKPRLFKDDLIRSMYISRHPKSFMTGVAIPTSGTKEDRIGKFSGKHASHLLFIVDEGDAVPDEVYDGIEGCMSGGMARLLIMFNPKIRAGNVYHREVQHQGNVVHLSAFNHPNVRKGRDVIPGAVDRPTTVRRINEWTRPLAGGEKDDASCFEVPSFLVGTTAQSASGVMYEPLPAGVRKIIEPAFSYMVLGDYPAQAAAQLISQAWIDRARTRYDLYVAKYGDRPPAGIKPKLGVDIAELGVDANVACLRWGGFVRIDSMWNGVDTDVSTLRTLQIYKDNDCDLAFIDGTGVGSSVAPAMARMGRKDGVRAISIKLASGPTPFIKDEIGEFHQLRDQLWWALREWLRTDETAMLPKDPYLLDELRAPQYEKLLSGKIRVTTKPKLRALLNRSPDRADALTLTFAPFERPKIMKLA